MLVIHTNTNKNEYKLGGIFYWGIMIKKLKMNINIQNTALRIYKYLGKRKVNNIHERSYIWVIDVAVVAGHPSAVLRPREGKYLHHFPSLPATLSENNITPTCDPEETHYVL